MEKIENKRVNAPIVAVSVFMDRARVCRQTVFDAEPGQMVLIFGNLPQNVDENSIQVNGRGAATILDVSVKLVWKIKNNQEQLSEWEAQLKQLAKKQLVLKNALGRNTQEKGLLDKIAAKATSISEKSKSEPADTGQWVELLEFYADKLEILDQQELRLQDELEELSKEQQKIEFAINQSGNRHGEQEKQVHVLIDVAENGRITSELSYTVLGPSWYPVYDLRVDSEKKRVQLTYKAMVKQNTGENWNGVQLSLSTAKAHVSGNEPKLNPWFIDFLPPPMAEDAMMDIAPMPRSMSRKSKQVEFSVADESGIEYAKMTRPQAQVETGATAVVFNIDGRVDIPANNEPHQASIAIIDFEAEFTYSSTPKISPFAYLNAKVKNTSEYPLLAGKSHVFLDNSFVSTTQLKFVAPEEEFSASLGIDEGIQVTRKLINRLSKNEGLINKKNKVTFSYKTEIKNRKKTNEKLILKDQLPISKHHDIVVELIEPVYKSDTENLTKDEQQFLEWHLTLEAGKTVVIPLQFSVEYRRDELISGL